MCNFFVTVIMIIQVLVALFLYMSWWSPLSFFPVRLIIRLVSSQSHIELGVASKPLPSFMYHLDSLWPTAVSKKNLIKKIIFCFTILSPFSLRNAKLYFSIHILRNFIFLTCFILNFIQLYFATNNPCNFLQLKAFLLRSFSL